MKKLLSIILLIPAFTFAQCDTIPPQFNGGNEALFKFIEKNFKATKEMQSGRIIVQFSIDSTGTTNNFEIKKGINTAANSEAVKVCAKMEFIPAKCGTQAITTKYTVPIIVNANH